MTIEEKLELFNKTAIEDATRQSAEVLAEYETSLDEQFKYTKESIVEKAKQAYHLEEEELIRSKNKIISQASRDVKKQVLEEENSFIDILFQLVSEKLDAYMKLPEYTQMLVKQIKEAVEIAEEEELIIYVNASDADKIAMLEKETGAKLTESTINFIGGTRAVIKSRNLLIDNSFLAKLTEEKENYTMQ